PDLPDRAPDRCPLRSTRGVVRRCVGIRLPRRHPVRVPCVRRPTLMKLIEALEILKRGPGPDAEMDRVFLAVGCEPLHLETFLKAQLSLARPGRRITCTTGLYGDLVRAIEQAPADVHQVACVIEWSDLDPRLGLRSLGGWQPGQVEDIVAHARLRA